MSKIFQLAEFIKDNLIVIIISIVIIFILNKVVRKLFQRARWRFINNYKFPDRLEKKLIEKYPHLNKNDAAQVISCLRDYFKICYMSRNQMVAMPSAILIYLE